MNPRSLLFLVAFSFSSLYSQTCFFSSASNIEASPGSNVCVKVHVHNYENIVGLQWTMNWDSLILDFTSTTDYNLNGLTSGNFGTVLTNEGVLTFTWADPTFSGSDLPDRTHIFSVCFDVIGVLNDSTGFDFSSSHTPVEIVDGNFTPIPFNRIPGEVVVKAIPTGGEKIRSGACIIDPSCLNNEQSNLRLAVEGGQDPISLNWTGPNGFSSSDFDLINPGPGNYTVSISDGIGFSRIDQYEILDLIPGVVDFQKGDVKCFGQQNGFINITVANGTMPYEYSWSNGSTFKDISSLAVDNYSVTITDSLGCTSESSFEINQPDSIVVNLESLTCPGLGLESGSASFDVTGGDEPYVFFWSTGAQTSEPLLEDLSAGNYMMSMTDANNCPFVITDFTLEVGIDSLQDLYFTCGNSDVPISIFASNAVNYSWSPADLFSCSDCPNPNINTDTDTTVQLTVGTNSGCSQIAELSILTGDICVWPGDCNDDGVANYLDVLWLGLANGSVGPARLVRSDLWIGQGASDWMSNTPMSNTNFKHIDSNGDGEINEMDLFAIISNYDEEHNFSPITSSSRSVVPPFFIAVADTVSDETVLSLDIILGTSEEAIASAFGLGFQLEFESSLVEPNSVSVGFDGWLGQEDQDLWQVNVIDQQAGVIEIGMTRTDGQGISGAGKIASLLIEFKSVTADTPTDLKILNAYLINENEGIIEVSSQISSTIISDDFSTSIAELNTELFQEK